MNLFRILGDLRYLVFIERLECVQYCYGSVSEDGWNWREILCISSLNEARSLLRSRSDRTSLINQD